MRSILGIAAMWAFFQQRHARQAEQDGKRPSPADRRALGATPPK